MKRVSMIVGLVSATLVVTRCAAGMAATPAERNLADFTNADNQPPDGVDDQTDDSEALRKAIAAGPGVVRIGPGYYRLGNIAVPTGVTIVGAGPATVIRPAGEVDVFHQSGVAQWRIRDLVLDGSAEGDWHARRDKGRRGIFVEKCYGFELSGITVRNFDGPGIELAFINIEANAAAWCDGGSLDRITATQNFIGILFNQRAEYIHAAQLSCCKNVTGCVIHAGNVKLSDSNFCANVDGLLIEDKDNGSHGAIANCLFNHNERKAIYARGVQNGMTIGNCCFFYGEIAIEDSVGVNVQNGQISCGVTVSGKGVNRIADNYVIPRDCAFQFTPTTIVSDNFAADGPWKLNQPQK